MILAFNIVNWILNFIILLLDLRLLLVTLTMKEGKMLFGLLTFLIVNDCLGTSVVFWHDIPSYFLGYSVIQNVYPLYVVAVIFQSLQFYYGLLMLPIFSLSNCAAIQFPFWYSHSRTRITVAIVVVLYFITFIMIVPLFTSCCGYTYSDESKSWYYDYSKPYTNLYQTGFFYLQIVCTAVMVVCVVFILVKLFQLHIKSNSSHNVTVHPRSFVLPVNSSHTTQSNETIKNPRMNPRERLAVSFILLAACFLIGTITFNFLGWKNDLASWITMLTMHLSKAKWIVYSLFLPDVRSAFFRFI